MQDGDLPPNARRILDAARDADDPTASDRERVDAAFGARLRALGIAAPMSVPTVSPNATSNAGSSAGATSAAPSGVGAIGKIALALVGVGIAAVALMRIPHADEHTQRARPASVQAQPQPQPQPQSQPQSQPTVNTRPAAPSVPTAARRVSARAHAAAPTAPLRVDTLHDEVALLETANAAVRQGDFASALRALDAHQQRFATGVLREERMGLRVLALCGLGDYTAGRSARRIFLRDAPHSVLARKVRAACVVSDADDHQERQP